MYNIVVHLFHSKSTGSRNSYNKKPSQLAGFQSKLIAKDAFYNNFNSDGRR